MNKYKVKIENDVLPDSFTFDELIENGLLDERDENIKVRLVEDCDWIVARDYPFHIKENNLSSKYIINEDGSVTRNETDMANYSLNDDGTINRSGNYNRPPKPDTNMIWSIICISVCLPFGLLALSESVKVDSRYSDGDIDGAIRASENSKKWAMWSLYSWLIFIAIIIFCAIVGH